MKKNIGFYLLIALLFCSSLKAQFVLDFCNSVTEKGDCHQRTNVFNVSKDADLIQMLITSGGGHRLGITNLQFQIFEINSANVEILNSTLEQAVGIDWTFAYKAASFPEGGKYKVYVYDEKKNLLCSSNLAINKI